MFLHLYLFLNTRKHKKNVKKSIFIIVTSLSISYFSFAQSPFQNCFTEINFGCSFLNHNNASNKINPNGFIGADLNYRFIEPGQNFLSNSYKYEWGSRINFISASFDFHSDKITPINKNSEKISSEIFKFKISNYHGSGYLEKDFMFYPYYNNTLGYNYYLLNPNKNIIDADDFIIPISYMLLAPNNIVFTKSNFYTPESNMSSLVDYNNKINFGSSRETGFIYHLHKKIYLKLGYECTIIYPQYIWFQNQTSNLIESSIQNLFGVVLLMIDYIASNEISSLADDIINSFITVGFQNLRKSKMHWPLNSGKPFFFDSFKIGISIQL